ncbi:MAG: SDR family oxidoreductase [Candidatus Sericytochromatia bacterium]|nr:SDR family oxidoreductase [Candidatus Sericytochromatia bacterium]
MKRTLITGGGGHIGLAVARRLVAEERPVCLFLHAQSREEAEEKQACLEPLFDGHRGLVAFAAGTMRAEDPFSAVNSQDISEVLHTASIIRFNVEAEDADAVNVAGARKALAFARQCKYLEGFSLVSSLYATGLAAGGIPEALLPDSPGFANHYERSKWEAETLLATAQDVPWRIFRVATIMADDDSGIYSQTNAVHNTIRLLYYGLISVIPGLPETPLYMVTRDFVVAAITGLMRRPAHQRVYHVAHPWACNPTLETLLDIAFEEFGEDPGFKRRRVLRPLYTDLDAFQALASGMAGYQSSVIAQALATLTPFAPQLFITKDFETHWLRQDWPEYTPMAGAAVARAVVRQGLASRFGKAPSQQEVAG